MYDTTTILNKPKNFITKADILSKISMEALFKKYIGNFKIGKAYNSPLRDDDNPSFGLFISKKDNQLLYKDLATGDCGDAFKLIKQIKGINSNFELYKYIYEDLNLATNAELSSSKKQLVYRRTDIAIKRRKLNESDINYWGSFGITEKTLRLFKVNAISELFINGVLKGKSTIDNPMYAYKIFDKFKIYRPLSTKIGKWFGNLSALDIQGYEQLPGYGNMLIITKSLKDVMVLYEMGYDAIAPPSESTDIPEVVINNIKNRFKKIVVLYDRDPAGMKFARRITSKWGFDFMFINKKYKTKDISDFVKAYSIEEAKEMLMQSLRQ